MKRWYWERQGFEKEHLDKLLNGYLHKVLKAKYWGTDDFGMNFDRDMIAYAIKHSEDKKWMK